jgi:endonuclease III
MKKKSFHTARVLSRVARSVEGFPPAALFELHDQGFGSLWEQLVATAGSFPSANTCAPGAPRCSVCPVLEWCRQVGVTTHR